MTTSWTQGYRPVTAEEGAADQGLSVRAARHTAANINNWLRYVGNYPFVFESRVATAQSGTMTATDVVSTLGTTTEQMILFLGRHYTPPFYPTVKAYLMARVNLPDPKGVPHTCTWRVRWSTDLYRGADAFDAAMAPPVVGYTTALALVSSSSLWTPMTSTLDIPIRNANDCLFWYLTAQNSHAEVQGTLLSLTLQPTMT